MDLAESYLRADYRLFTGFPDQYIAFYDIAGEMNLVNLALFYADIGVVVRDEGVSWGTRPPSNHSNVRIHEFVLHVTRRHC